MNFMHMQCGEKSQKSEQLCVQIDVQFYHTKHVRKEIFTFCSLSKSNKNGKELTQTERKKQLKQKEINSST